MVDRTARRRTLVALLIGTLAAIAVVLVVLFVASEMASAGRERNGLRDRLTKLEAEFRARTGQEPGPFETSPATTTTTVPRSSSLPAAHPSPTAAPVLPRGPSGPRATTTPSPPVSSAPAPTQPPPNPPTTTTTAPRCLVNVTIPGVCQ